MPLPRLPPQPPRPQRAREPPSRLAWRPLNGPVARAGAVHNQLLTDRPCTSPSAASDGPPPPCLLTLPPPIPLTIVHTHARAAAAVPPRAQTGVPCHAGPVGWLTFLDSRRSHHAWLLPRARALARLRLRHVPVLFAHSSLFAVLSSILPSSHWWFSSRFVLILSRTNYCGL